MCRSPKEATKPKMQCADRPLKRRRSEYVARVNHFRNSSLGPETTKDLREWPQIYLSALKKSGLLENIAQLFRDGGLAATDFSGLDAPAAGWAALRDDSHELVKWEQPWEMLGWVRSCDNDAVAKGLLERMSAGSACVLNDVIERLAPEGQEWLRMQALAFDTFGRDSLKWRIAVQNIKTFISANERWLFPELAKSFCSVHGCQCFVQPLAKFQARGST